MRLELARGLSAIYWCTGIACQKCAAAPADTKKNPTGADGKSDAAPLQDSLRTKLAHGRAAIPAPRQRDAGKPVPGNQLAAGVKVSMLEKYNKTN